MWHCFDFDGVLAHPYTSPELLFPGAERLLRQLKARGDTIVVASFNPRAYHVLQDLHDEGVIHDMRCGSNDSRWWADGTGPYQDAVHRRDLSKAAMIRAMVPADAATVRFYDDDRANIDDVASHMPHVGCYWVSDWSKGITPVMNTWFSVGRRPLWP
jgi:hypothetical protein